MSLLRSHVMVSTFLRATIALACISATFIAATASADDTPTLVSDEVITEASGASMTEEVIVTANDLPFGLGWLDNTQRVSSERVNLLANQIDRFFGVPRSDLEAPYSSLRLSLNNGWTEAEGSEQYMRLRGRVYLPRLNERLSLVFSEDQGEGEDFYNANPTGTSPENTRLNVELNLDEDKNSRLDFRVGLRSSMKLRTSMRYRLDTPFGEKMNHRLTQTFQFIDGRGFGSITRSELNRQITETSLLRWTNDLAFEEEFTGAEIRSELRWTKRVDQQSALAPYARVEAETSPGFISAYVLGLRYRQAIHKTWLFAEVEPSYSWRKQTADLGREGELAILFRIEMAIGKLD